MRFSHSGPAPTGRHDWQTLKTLVPYLLAFKGRLAIAIALLVGAKLANVSVPLLLKDVVDTLSTRDVVLAVPLGLVMGSCVSGPSQ